MAPTSREFGIFSTETISCKCPRWDQQICYNNAHLWAWKCEQMPHLLGDKAKILPVKEAVKPQIHEVNIMNAPVLTVTNTTQATTSECLMKINCILFIEYRWPERFHFETMSQQSCNAVQFCRLWRWMFFFQIGSFFLYKPSIQSLKQWHFLFKFFAKLSKLSSARRSFFSTIDCSPFQNVYTIAVLTPSIGQFGKSNNITINWPLRVMSDHIFL